MLRLWLIAVGVAAGCVAGADPTAEFLSGPFALGYLGLGLARSPGRARTAEALAATALLTEALKRATRVPRPDTGSPDSFPSGHASAAFCVATMQASAHPKEAGYWYAGAGLVAWSRVSLDRHRPSDVLAGAALGYLVARLELSRPKGWFVGETLGGPGIVATARF